MEKKEIIQTLDDIRDMMAKSSRFQAISGVSIILVGLYACVAALLVAPVARGWNCLSLPYDEYGNILLNTPHLIRMMVLSAVLLFALSFATVTGWRGARPNVSTCPSRSTSGCSRCCSTFSSR